MLMLPGVQTLAQTPASPAAGTQVPGGDRLTPSELEVLLGPIALYPDPLLANVLAAAVYPEEVAEAAKFIAGGGKPEQVDAKPWEAPVKAVAKIPDAIKMMGQYKEWTVALGQAYLIQAKDVMDVVQSLRRKAQASGALQSSPQQKVVVEQQLIYIKPADPEIIYVPSYSSSVVYVDHHDSDVAAAGVIGFGVGVAAGLIIANNMDCDYHYGCVSYGWHGGGNDVNISRGGNTINTGDINIGNTANIGNRVGNEGNAYAPNKSKSLATAQPNQMNQFKGGVASANPAVVPGGRISAASGGSRTPGTGAQMGSRPVAQPNVRPTDQPTARPSMPAIPPRPSYPSAFSGGRDTQAASERGAASRSQTSGGANRSAPSRGGGGGGGSGGGARGRR